MNTRRHTLLPLILPAILCSLLPGCGNDPEPTSSSHSTSNTAQRTWVAIEPVQCLTNPWEADWVERHGGDATGYPAKSRPCPARAELEIIRAYYSGMGIEILDASAASKYDAVCAACSCAEGHTLYLRVPSDDVETMTGLGYREEAPSSTECAHQSE